MATSACSNQIKPRILHVAERADGPSNWGDGRLQACFTFEPLSCFVLSNYPAKGDRHKRENPYSNVVEDNVTEQASRI
jgi:hypothetical protein